MTLLGPGEADIESAKKAKATIQESIYAPGLGEVNLKVGAYRAFVNVNNVLVTLFRLVSEKTTLGSVKQAINSKELDWKIA